MPIVGLDLGQHSFRAIELERGRKEDVINRFGSYENPKLNINSGEAEDIDLYASSLRDFFQETGFSTQNVVMGLEESSVFMRIIKVPAMNDKDIATAIKYEAEKYIPLPLDQVTLSYQKLDEVMEDVRKVNVQIVAAKNKKVNDFVEIVKRAGLKPAGIEPETLAIGRALGDAAADANGTVILNIGYNTTLIVVVYGGYVRFTRTIPMGGDVITKAIQQSLKLDYIQADEYKKVYGLDPTHFDGKIADIIKPIIDQIIMEVKRASIFFTNSNTGANIKRIVVAGGTARMPELIRYLIDNIDFEVELGNPLGNLVFSPKMVPSRVTSLTENAPMYSTAVGLALKEI